MERHVDQRQHGHHGDDGHRRRGQPGLRRATERRAPGISSAATTVLVDRLERTGHLERVRDTVDRRRVTVTATPTGRAAVLSAWLPAIRELDDVCRSLSESEQAFARDLMGRLGAAMARS